MTTYTITTTTDNETYYDCSPEMLKRLRKNYGAKNVKATKNETPKNWHYRGSKVLIIEERQNGWTLVHDFTNGGDRFAVTTELEYR
jgi:hypothetical protein